MTGDAGDGVRRNRAGSRSGGGWGEGNGEGAAEDESRAGNRNPREDISSFRPPLLPALGRRRGRSPHKSGTPPEGGKEKKGGTGETGLNKSRLLLATDPVAIWRASRAAKKEKDRREEREREREREKE